MRRLARSSLLRSHTAIVAVALCVGFTVGKAHAQTTPGLTQGQTPTAAQWNSFFAQKQDFLGVPPLLSSGGALSGKLTLSASIASAAQFNMGQGTAPTSPVNGDMWITPAGLFIRVAGTTQGPMLSTGGGGFLGQSNLWTAANTFGSMATGNITLKWNPLAFGIASTGVVTRINRLLVGEAMASSSDVGPVTVKDWSETLIPNTTGVAQFAAVDTTGNLGVYGAARASDYRTAFGAATGGAEGITGLGYNDDTTGSPIATGGNLFGVRASGVGGITLGNQSDVDNGGSVVDVEPSVGFTAGTTVAQLATPGAYSVATANVSALYVAGLGRGGGPVARKGYVTLSGALDTSIGAGGGGIAFDSFRGMSMRWRNAGLTTDTEMWGNASGLNINSNVVVTGSVVPSIAIAVANGGTGDTGTAWGTWSPSPSCGSATFGSVVGAFKTIGKTTFARIRFIITAVGNCAGNLTLTLPNTANGAAAINGQEGVNTGVGVTCVTVSTSSLTCVEQPRVSEGGTVGSPVSLPINSWETNDDIRMSGVYESM